jgi:hypothetical protein
MTTLETLSETIVSIQRQINDLDVIVSSQGQQLVTHGNDIHTLQDPPIGVPTELLGWLATHGIREVDTDLDTDLTTLETGSTSNSEAIDQLVSDLAQEVSDRTTADGDLTDIVNDLQTQIDTNLDTLTQEITDRSNLSVTVSDGLDTVNARIDSLQSDVTTASTVGTTSSAALSSQIASLSASLQTAQTQITLLQGIGVDPAGAQASQITTLTTIANDAATAVALETTNRTNADNTLQLSINTLNASLSGLNSGLASEKSDRQAADLDIQSDVSSLQATVSGQSGLISSETAARIAADATLTTNVDTNTTDIADNTTDIANEVTDRTNADIALQAAIDANTANVATNTANIALNTTGIATINTRFSVVKDGSGYVTGWQIVDQSTGAGAFKVKDLNNDVRVQNPGYVGKYFPPISILGFTLPVSYDVGWGGATSNDFQGTDTNNYTRLVKVYATQTVGINGSCFLGVDNSTGGNLNRLGQVLTTFRVDFSGSVNRYLSLWYRIKTAPSDTTQRWLPVALADNTVAGQRTYEYTRGQAVVQISVTADKVIEFGLTALNTLDATIANSGSPFIYGGSVSVTTLNMVTIS